MIDELENRQKADMKKLKIFTEPELRKFIPVYYLVGIIGFALPWTREIFKWMIPLNMVLWTILLGITDRSGWGKLVPVAAIIFICGFFVEVAGVNSGVLFGVYAYGNHMGPELWNTPLVIGLSWLTMLYLSMAVVQEVTMQPVYRTVLTAVLMVVYDFLLEPAAMWMNMWNWQGGKVPMMNYIIWFLVSLTLAALFPVFRLRIRNRLAKPLFIAQMVFFLLINVIALVDKMISK
jgi:putative membrane protein